MKKLIFLLSFLAIGFISNAQSTVPRYGITPGNDATGRVINYQYKSIVDAAGADTATVIGTSYDFNVKVALTDSLFVKATSVKNCSFGDNMTVIVSGASGKFLKFSTTNMTSSGTVTLSSGGVATVRFKFNGVKWVETGRLVF